MKSLFLAALLLAAPAFAQSIVSPDVQADGRVTFRLQAPNARQVQVVCEGVTSAMQKDADGVWTFTSPPMQPDIYDYSFTVDGVHTLDPLNSLLKQNLLNPENMVHVAGPKSLLWEVNDVPHGRLESQTFDSKVAGEPRNFVVYTPPGYDAKARTRYPVLYLLHGYSDDASSWSTAGRANVILDNLIARGQAKPMIVVMPLGYGAMEIVTNGWSRVNDQVLWQKNLDRFGQILLREIIPQVEKSYRVRKGRDARAIAGLSMGGAESLLTGLNHLDRFGWVGSFSAGGLGTNYVSEFPKLGHPANDQLHLLWIGCGTADWLHPANEAFCGWLKSEDIHYTWVESPGGHAYTVWRRYLGEFAPLLFQPLK
jgi:enterochelin esterase family protein